MTPRLSCALPPTADAPNQARHAEQLGYQRIWLFEAPALYGDLWVAMTRVAEATERIGFASGVAVPGLRHPMVTASAAASVAELAPGRLTLAFGTGHTGRRTLGQPPVRLGDLAREIRQVRSLLAGEVTEIDGRACQLVPPAGFGPHSPIDVPIWMAADGPRANAMARELDVPGILATTHPEAAGREVALLRFGTVLRPSEDHTTPRVIEAAGPGWACIIHATWEVAPLAVDDMPGGKQWRSTIESLRPEGQRHLDVHQGHLSRLTDRDRTLATAAGSALITAGWTGTPAQVRDHVREAATAGITEIVYTPTGPDIYDELEAFAETVRQQ